MQELQTIVTVIFAKSVIPLMIYLHKRETDFIYTLISDNQLAVNLTAEAC